MKQFDMFRDFLSYMEWQQARPSVTTTAVSSFAPLQSTQRLTYTAAPSDRPLSAVGNPPGPFSLPASVRGSWAGGVQGQQGRPLARSTPPDYSARLCRASCTLGPSHEGDRSWGAPFSWGDVGEGAPTAVGDQNYLGPYHGEYYYPSDSYRPHSFEQQPPPFQDLFGTDFDPSFPFSANSDADFPVSVDIDNYRGVVPLAVDKEARSILIKYMGDLYRDAPSVGEPSGAGSELSEWLLAQRLGLFADASRPKPGINLPSEFSRISTPG